MRYQQLQQIIEQVKPRTIIEVGTWSGDRAIEMATEALKHTDGEVVYYGYDLFETATAETDALESNVKPHFEMIDVIRKLDDFRESNPRFDFSLHCGDTRKTLSAAMLDSRTAMDFPALAFIDGGHSLETIGSDYHWLSGCSHIVLDDYYVASDEGCPDVTKIGCNQLVDQLKAEGKEVNILPASDPVKGGGRVHMVAVGFNPQIHLEKRLKVQTINAVKNDVIIENVTYALSKNLTEFRQCSRHWERAVIVSGGPSYKDFLDDYRALQDDGCYLFCVKTSHDWLIENGLIPYGCILLDPRPHVLDFVENPHPDVIYFTASQVHPRTLDRLIERKAKIVLYHAMVGAGEDKLLKGKSMITGGSTSATRGVSLINGLGFSRYDLYAYDTCYWSVPENYPHTTGGKKLMEVKVNGRQFLTTPELIAQAQDFEKIVPLATDSNAMTLNVHGDGIIPHVWNGVKQDKPNFLEIYG